MKTGNGSGVDGFDGCWAPPNEEPPDWVWDDDPKRKKASEPSPVRPRFRRCPDLVAAILERAEEGFVSHTIGGEELYRLRLGGAAVLTGAPGAGKTSLAIGIGIEHARERGPVIFVSIEMDADELGARAVGMECDASWEDVLCGRVPRDAMDRALELPRFVVLDGDHATLLELEAAVTTVREQYPGEPILVVIDYLQIVPSDERDMRARVAAAAQAVRRLAKRLRVVVLAISQPSRAAGKALSSGELLGADSMTAMAESAEIERAAYITLALGSSGTERDDGSRLVDLNIGKGRMGGGDRVAPVSFTGRSGKIRLAGKSRAAAEVRAERKAAGVEQKERAALLAMITVLERSKEPLTRAELILKIGLRKAIGVAAIQTGLTSGELVEVRQKSKQSKTWRLWTRKRAVEAGTPIVEVDL